jgi:hypothetical protein
MRHLKRLLSMAIVCGLSLVLSLGFSGSAGAHQFHTSSAELDWNADSGRWEVALRILATDLELALERQEGKKLNLDSAEGIELIQKYLLGRFQILPQSVVEKLSSQTGQAASHFAKNEESAQLNWVGHECEGGWMWLYFELQPPKSEQPLALVSQLLTEINEDQINIVSIRSANKKRVTQQTNRKQAWLDLVKL